MTWLNKILQANLNAILITILVHMVLLFAFLLAQLNPPEQQNEAVIMMDPENLEEMERYFEAKEELEDKMQEMADAENMSLEEIRNLAREGMPEETQTQEAQEKQNTAEEIQKQYEDELRKEMYGDDYEEIKAELEKEISRDEFSEYRGTPDSQEESGDASYYSGPSLVKVELDNKDLRHYYIDIPVFTCRGSGTVVVGIKINPDGRVSEAEVKSSRIRSDEACLIESSLQSARKSRFAASRQGTTGTITYQFVPQD
ncbi:MAG: energy transducer TonB [Bacteroidota bacterium]